MRAIELGCIGCGFIAEVHLQNAMAMSGVRVRAVADIQAGLAERFHQRFGSNYWATEAQALFDDPLLDAIIICTHPVNHAELAIRAAASGKHIFLEKPMATSSGDCLEIIQACARAHVTLAVDLKFRFSPAVQAVRKLIPKPAVIVSQAAMSRLEEDDPHMDQKLGGGIVADLGSHSLDLACFLAGAEPVRLFARGNRLRDRRSVCFDAVVGTLEFASGCVASFLISDCGEWDYSSKWFFQVADGERTAVIHNHGRTVSLGGLPRRRVREVTVPGHEIGTYDALKDFIAAIRINRAPRVVGEDGMRSVLISESIFRSLSSGEPVEFKNGSR